MSDIVRAEIERLVELVNDQSKEILAYPDVIPLIELDLLKESLRRLYQHVNYLSSSYDIQNLNIPVPQDIVPQVVAEEKEEELDETDQQAEELINQAEAQFEEKAEVQEPITAVEDLVEDKEEIVEEKKGEAPVNVEATLADLLAEVETAAEMAKEEEKKEPKAKKVEEVKEEAPKAEAVLEQEEPMKPVVEEAPIVNESKKEEMLIADQIGKTTISSLKSAIGINDKFQFINELFDGSMPKYNAFIKKMDAYENRPEAITEISNMKQQHNWQDDNSAFVMLQDYVDRRF